jgi:hypothetical protein
MPLPKRMMTPIPAMAQHTAQNDLKPHMGYAIRVTALWSCSTLSVRYFERRMTIAVWCVLLSRMTVAALLPLRSMVIFLGALCVRMALCK